jgi:hypothetical protein
MRVLGCLFLLAAASLSLPYGAAVAEKKMSGVIRKRQVSLGWAWVNRGGALLGTLGRAEPIPAPGTGTAKPQPQPAT